MKHIDLFSGIGGFALAASWVWPDHEIVTFCEKDKYCQKILKKHWPDAPICEDIYELKGQRCDLITGGFPCQPFSTAGKQRGTDDDRYLWPEMLRIIREAKPTWVVGENVPGIIGMALDQVLIDLEMEGYACQCFIIPACGVDAPHRRDRAWIVAHATSGDDRGRSREVPGQDEQQAKERQEERATEFGGASKNVADSKKLHSNGSGEHTEQSQRQVPELGKCSGSNDATNSDSKRLQGQRQESLRIEQEQHNIINPCRWLPEPNVGRVANGISKRVDRLRALGNAIVPQVAEQIFLAINSVDKERLF